jgi:hypothetical protein
MIHPVRLVVPGLGACAGMGGMAGGGVVMIPPGSCGVGMLAAVGRVTGGSG